MKNIINKIEQRFNEFYQILIDAKKNDNIKDNNIPEDVYNPKEL